MAKKTVYQRIQEATNDYSRHTPAGEGETGWHPLAADLISLADVLGIEYTDSNYEMVLEEARALDENNVDFQDYDDEWGKMGEMPIDGGSTEADVAGYMLELVSGTGAWALPEDRDRPMLKDIHQVMVAHLLKKHGFPEQGEWVPEGQRER